MLSKVEGVGGRVYAMRVAATAILIAFLWCSCTRSTPHAETTTKAPSLADSDSCLKAATKELGTAAQIARCGHLTATGALEAVGFIPLKGLREMADGIPVSKLVVLRREQSGVVELTAGQDPPRNSVGYIGVDFIDDSDEGGRYRVSFSDDGALETPGFKLALFYLSPTGEEEGIPIEISWNRSLGRFQEYTVNRDPQ